MRNHIESDQAVALAVDAARAAGRLLRQNLRAAKVVNETKQHDLKLELDVRCQKLIEARLRARFPQTAILGEEGVLGNPRARQRWVVDPIDGTVNFAYGIPHACVSIALQERADAGAPGLYEDGYRSVAGVIFDPFTDELWTARRGHPACLNGQRLQVSRHTRLGEAVVALGFSKSPAALRAMLPGLNRLVPRVRKIRILGSAALELAYVAAGRLDAYVESSLRLWDIAAGGLLVECAGGEFWWQSLKGPYRYSLIASNGRLRRTALEVWQTRVP